MARSLRDIPGSNRPRKRFVSSRERDLWAPPRSVNLDMTPRGLRLNPVRKRWFGPRNRTDLSILLIAAAAVGLVLWMAVSFWQATRVHAEVIGLASGAELTPDNGALLHVQVRVPSDDDRYRASVSVDGVEVHDEIGFLGDTLHLRPTDLVEQQLVEGALDEGEHVIKLSVGRLFLSDAVFRWRYTIDSVAPTLEVPTTLDAVPIDKPVTVRGTVEDGATMRLDGEPLDIDDGEFEVEFAHPPTGVLRFDATDKAGNRAVVETVVPVAYPETTRAVHVSAAAWGNDGLRAGVLDLIDRGLVDTVELDIKDERGVIGYASKVPMARRIGAIREEMDIEEALATLRKRNVRVIGRIVAFRDPIYAEAAWAAGNKDEVLQSPDGEMLGAYGGFANYVHPKVRKYNLDVAVEAAELGVSDILWDYIRRPEGAPDTMVVPNLTGPSSAVVAGFLAESHEVLREMGVYQGASVFGIAAAAGDSIAQDVPAMARAVDYLAPMIYPSHWGPGQYRVTSPIREPYEITKRSLAHFKQVTAGSGVRLVPWIQDFTLGGVPYGPAEVKAQIDAAAELGINGFLLWNPGVRYTAEALTPIS